MFKFMDKMLWGTNLSKQWLVDYRRIPWSSTAILNRFPIHLSNYVTLSIIDVISCLLIVFTSLYQTIISSTKFEYLYTVRLYFFRINTFLILKFIDNMMWGTGPSKQWLVDYRGILWSPTIIFREESLTHMSKYV